MNNNLKWFLFIGLLTVVFVASAYGANRWFRRGSSSCANGQCSTVDVVPEPTPVVIPTPTPLPDNIILDHTATKKRNPKNYSDSNQEGPLTTNDLLGPPDACDCKTCKCKECVCKDCKCEKCPGKKIELLTTETVEVPSLLGKTYWEAKAGRGEFIIDGESNSDTDVVVSQVPAAGESANKGTSIKLIFKEIAKPTTTQQQDNNYQTEYMPRRRGFFRRVLGR